MYGEEEREGKEGERSKKEEKDKKSRERTEPASVSTDIESISMLRSFKGRSRNHERRRTSPEDNENLFLFLPFSICSN